MQVSVLEHELGHPERSATRQQIGQHPDGGQQRCLQGYEQQQEPEREDDADHQWRLGTQERLQVVVLGHGTTDQRAGGQLGPEPVDRLAHLRRRWIELGHRLDERPPVSAGLRRHDLSDTRVGLRDRDHAGGLRPVGHELQRSGGARSKRLLHLRVAVA